mmetsp:Transcript_27124/g.75629  ORF Transcript_27124/g.75629 Transcript_27124/m.75629 type:complete len:252 (+) Transcript_27124:454-1209(+)
MRGACAQALLLLAMPHHAESLEPLLRDASELDANLREQALRAPDGAVQATRLLVQVGLAVGEHPRGPRCQRSDERHAIIVGRVIASLVNADAVPQARHNVDEELYGGVDKALFNANGWQAGSGVRRRDEKPHDLADRILVGYLLQVKEETRGEEFRKVHQDVGVVFHRCEVDQPHKSLRVEEEVTAVQVVVTKAAHDLAIEHGFQTGLVSDELRKELLRGLSHAGKLHHDAAIRVKLVDIGGIFKTMRQSW